MAVVMALLSLPATLLHELTHAVVSAPFADTLAVVVEPRGMHASVAVDWRDDAPDWGLVLAHYAPMLAGLFAAAAVSIHWVVSGGRLPQSTVGWAKLAIAAVSWGIYVTPSEDDRDLDREGGA